LGSGTYTLTCYGAAGTQPATASLLNTSATTCTITDEFGGPPYNQAPVGGLPANVYLPESSESGPYELYPYYFGAAFCPGSNNSPRL
jgi:hypothetical protein